MLTWPTTNIVLCIQLLFYWSKFAEAVIVWDYCRMMPIYRM